MKGPFSTTKFMALVGSLKYVKYLLVVYTDRKGQVTYEGECKNGRWHGKGTQRSFK